MANITHISEAGALTLKPTSAESVPIAYNLSRQKALDTLQGQEPKADEQVYDRLYELYYKIGATGELPDISFDHHGSPTQKSIRQRNSYFNDLWKTMYLYNAIVPGYLPFDIIIEQFVTYAVQNSDTRKGNNQGAIITQFNAWIQDQAVIHKLIRLRDSRYPHEKPKSLTEKNQQKLSELSTEEIHKRIEQLQPLKEIAMTNQIIERYQQELKKRKSKQ